MRTSIVTLSLASVFVLACATNPPPVPLTADAAGRSLFAGNWSGSYYTVDGGQAGSIELSFHAHDTTGVECRGDIVMAPWNRNGNVLPYDAGGISAPEEIVRVLVIQSLEVKGPDMVGIIAPYPDPETGEMLSTMFEGKIVGDRITGTLVTYHAKSGERDTGSWEATRKPD